MSKRAPKPIVITLTQEDVQAAIAAMKEAEKDLAEQMASGELDAFLEEPEPDDEEDR